MFDVKEIMNFVPHRYPFLLIDRVTEFTPVNVDAEGAVIEGSVTTLKNVTINEAQFQGHFPGEPVFPGVLMIENMAQSACFLLSKSEGELDNSKVYYLGTVNKVKFRKPVVPGDQMVTSVELVKSLGSMAMVKATVKVDGKMVAKAELAFSAA